MISMALCVFSALAACPAPAVFAEPGLPSPKVYRARRAALARQFKGEPILVFGAVAPQAYSPFRQNNRFYYLTGVAEPGAAILLLKGGRKEILFLDPGNPRMEKWDGPRLRPGPEAEKTTGIRDIRLRKELSDAIDGLLAGKPTPRLCFPLAPEEIGTRINDASSPQLIARQKDPLDGGTWREDRIRLKLLDRYEGLVVTDVSPAIRTMRVIKGKEEIAALREAGRISALGMMAAMKATRPGTHEYQIEAAMAHVCRTEGGQGWGYAPIVGSGPNSLILHYNLNNRKTEAGDLVLMDAGFSWNYYVMDITRTFPVSGRFTPEQRKAYDDLLKVQIECINRVRPGTSLIELNGWVNGQLRAKGYGRHLVHFLGHYVGMAVHDPGAYNQPLKPGHVITIEPGIYIEDKEIGIRIEDTVVVTPSGCEVLSRGVPKDGSAIESLMKGR
jgi:Xaa-Pro aminopeptidase